jgi:hypothetical protein
VSTGGFTPEVATVTEVAVIPTEVIRLSAFSDSQAPANPFGRILVFAIIFLFAISAFRTLRPQK